MPLPLSLKKGVSKENIDHSPSKILKNIKSAKSISFGDFNQ